MRSTTCSERQKFSEFATWYTAEYRKYPVAEPRDIEPLVRVSKNRDRHAPCVSYYPDMEPLYSNRGQCYGRAGFLPVPAHLSIKPFKAWRHWPAFCSAEKQYIYWCRKNLLNSTGLFIWLLLFQGEFKRSAVNVLVLGLDFWRSITAPPWPRQTRRFLLSAEKNQASLVVALILISSVTFRTLAIFSVIKGIISVRGFWPQWWHQYF